MMRTERCYRMSRQVPLLLTLCLEENTILVSTAILDCIGNPRLIQMMINDEKRSLIIHPCKDGERESILIPDTLMYQFEYPGQSLLRRIRRLTKWPDTNPRAVYGTYIPSLMICSSLRMRQNPVVRLHPVVCPHLMMRPRCLPVSTAPKVTLPIGLALRNPNGRR